MGAAAATSQVNARIDAVLKEEGDAGLASAGYTPTQAIRSLWRLASRLRANPARLAEMLEAGGDGPEEERMGRRRASLLRGAELYAKGLEGMGVDLPLSVDARPYDELREDAYREAGIL